MGQSFTEVLLVVLEVLVPEGPEFLYAMALVAIVVELHLRIWIAVV